MNRITRTVRHAVAVSADLTKDLFRALFVDRDHLRRILGQIAFDRLVISVSHKDYITNIGGTEKIIGMQQRALNERGISYIHIFPDCRGQDLFYGISIDGAPIGYYSPDIIQFLFKCLLDLGYRLDSVHIHHILNGDLASLADILQGLDAFKYAYLHDFYTACPQINFLFNGDCFCRYQPVDSSLCRSCTYGPPRGDAIGQIKSFFRELDCTFIAPSEFTKRIWCLFYPEFESRVLVVPHQKVSGAYERTRRNDKIKVAYVGYQSKNKGYESFREIARRLNRNDYDLYYFGTWMDAIDGVEYRPVTYIGKDESAMTEALRQENIDVALLLSLCPETYAFTYYESLVSGCFIATFTDSGNIAEQVKARGNGAVFADEAALIGFFEDIGTVRRFVDQTFAVRHPGYLESNVELAEMIDGRMQGPADVRKVGSLDRSRIKAFNRRARASARRRWVFEIRKRIPNVTKRFERTDG